MTSTPPKKRRERRVEAFAVVGLNTGRMHYNSDATQYAIYLDGFVGEERMLSLRGRGLKVDLLPCTISYTLPLKKKK